MKNKLKPLLTPVLLGGIWGVLTYLVGSLVLFRLPFTSFLFYPFLFGGIVVIVAFKIESKIQFTRALVVGLTSGFIYQILSPTLPFLTSVLVGASLGGGLAHDEGTFKDLLSRLFPILKGIILFPIIICVGGLFAGSSGNIFGSQFVIWFFWGAFLSLAIFFIYKPLLNPEYYNDDLQTPSEIDEFKSETSKILRDLNHLRSRY